MQNVTVLISWMFKRSLSTADDILNYNLQTLSKKTLQKYDIDLTVFNILHVSLNEHDTVFTSTEINDKSFLGGRNRLNEIKLFLYTYP